MTWRTMQHYRDRDDMLREMGFSSYRAYLRSGTWKKLRGKIVANDVECEGCHRIATQAHHEFYSPENLSGESMDGVVPLCRKCHEYVEFGARRTKLTPTQVEYRLCKLRAKKAGKKVKIKQKHRLR